LEKELREQLQLRESADGKGDRRVV
jgi:hypothetical protein